MLVQEVVKDGPADKAGIEGGNTSATIDGGEVRLGGDIITEVDGEKVDEHGRDRSKSSTEPKPGDELELTILRDGEDEDRHRRRSANARLRVAGAE